MVQGILHQQYFPETSHANHFHFTVAFPPEIITAAATLASPPELNQGELYKISSIPASHNENEGHKRQRK